MIQNLVQTWIVRLTKPRLVRAARKGDLAKIEKLLSAGSEVDVSDRCGRTPLMEACRNGHNKAVELLLEHGANPYRVSFSHKDAFCYALTLEVMDTLSARRIPRRIEDQ